MLDCIYVRILQDDTRSLQYQIVVILIMSKDMREMAVSYFKTRHQKQSEGIKKRNLRILFPCFANISSRISSSLCNTSCTSQNFYVFYVNSVLKCTKIFHYASAASKLLLNPKFCTPVSFMPFEFRVVFLKKKEQVPEILTLDQVLMRWKSLKDFVYVLSP